MTRITHDVNDDRLRDEGRRINESRRQALIVHEETELDIARAFCERIISLGGDARAVSFEEAESVAAAGVAQPRGCTAEGRADRRRRDGPPGPDGR